MILKCVQLSSTDTIVWIVEKELGISVPFPWKWLTFAKPVPGLKSTHWWLLAAQGVGSSGIRHRATA